VAPVAPRTPDERARPGRVTGAEGRARAWGGAVGAVVAGWFISKAPDDGGAAGDIATRPPGGRVGRGPGWSPGPSSPAQADAFPPYKQ
jgi:hypothetical protein